VWQQLLDRLFDRIAGRFTRFMSGLLAELPAKNCWTIAEHVGDSSPAGMQHLLSRAVWDADGVRDDLRDYVAEHLGDPGGSWCLTRLRPGRAPGDDDRRHANLDVDLQHSR
jgi:SRSO17 transposase